MRRKLTAAFALATLAGGGATILSSAEVANAQIVQVCKRQVLGDLGEFVCVEWSTCWHDNAGQWACDDGIYGGPPAN
ncbi:MAG TPA: hypothetical protein VHI11_02195 [Jiangellaceae bacterium]|jgi:hypothetical protein|nr:hypothetical protein [Jiangellaceae bacterium]